MNIFEASLAHFHKIAGSFERLIRAEFIQIEISISSVELQSILISSYR